MQICRTEKTVTKTINTTENVDIYSVDGCNSGKIQIRIGELIQTVAIFTDAGLCRIPVYFKDADKMKCFERIAGKYYAKIRLE